MKFRGRPMARLLVLAGLALTASPAPRVSSAPACAIMPDPAAQTRLDSLRPPEVRLRKLHLVRPDLICYPIMYEICC